MTAADPTAAIADYLLEHVGLLVAGNVFRPQLPADFDPFTQPCIVVRPGGGYTQFGGASTLMLGDPHLRIGCYGTNEMQAQSIAREAWLVLRALTRQVRAGVLLHAVNMVSGPIPVIDPTTHWPLCAFSVQVVHTEPALV